MIRRDEIVMNSSVHNLCRELLQHPPEPQVAGIGGSPRHGGNSDILLASILAGAASADLATEALHLRDYQFQGCIGCEQCRTAGICTGLRDGMTVIYPSVAAAQALVLVSPTHNYNLTSWMKAFIDRLYCFYRFDDERPRGWSSSLAGQGRKAVLAVVCEQEDERDMGFALPAMRLPLEALGYEIVGELAVFGIFDRARVKKRGDVLDRAGQLGADLAAAIR
jgi:multimeric flavodoxin WrbA